MRFRNLLLVTTALMMLGAPAIAADDDITKPAPGGASPGESRSAPDPAIPGTRMPDATVPNATAPGSTRSSDPLLNTPASPRMGSPATENADNIRPRQRGALTPGSLVADKELLKADVKNANNNTIGEVEAVQLSTDGKVDTVIIKTGGFLGMGGRDVAVKADMLTVADNGKDLKTDLTKEQLKSMPPYKYADTSQRGKMFSDSGVVQN